LVGGGIDGGVGGVVEGNAESFIRLEFVVAVNNYSDRFC
jgi:hypothetical protein